MVDKTDITIQKLRAQAREKNCSYRDLAAHSGLSERAIRNIFLGVTKAPRAHTLELLAQAINEIQ